MFHYWIWRVLYVPYILILYPIHYLQFFLPRCICPCSPLTSMCTLSGFNFLLKRTEAITMSCFQRVCHRITNCAAEPWAQFLQTEWLGVNTAEERSAEAVTGAQQLSSVMGIFHFSLPPNAGYLTVSRASTRLDERGRWGSDSTLLCLLCRLLTMEVPLPTRVHCLIAIRINATCLRWTRSLAGRMARHGEYRSQCLNWSHTEASSGSV